MTDPLYFPQRNIFENINNAFFRLLGLVHRPDLTEPATSKAFKPMEPRPLIFSRAAIYRQNFNVGHAFIAFFLNNKR
jgi:hypothetical protein